MFGRKVVGRVRNAMSDGFGGNTLLRPQGKGGGFLMDWNGDGQTGLVEALGGPGLANLERRMESRGSLELRRQLSAGLGHRLDPDLDVHYGGHRAIKVNVVGTSGSSGVTYSRVAGIEVINIALGAGGEPVEGLLAINPEELRIPSPYNYICCGLVAQSLNSSSGNTQTARVTASIYHETERIFLLPEGDIPMEDDAHPLKLRCRPVPYGHLDELVVKVGARVFVENEVASVDWAGRVLGTCFIRLSVGHSLESADNSWEQLCR